MNVEQRKKLAAAQLEISKQFVVIEQIKDEIQDSFDNMPEDLQQGDKGQEIKSAISTLEDILSNLD